MFSLSTMVCCATWLGSGLAAAVASYACIAAWVGRRTTLGTHWDAPKAVSVFKPLCGVEPGLEANLTTLFAQTHPNYQLLFGVRDPSDPSIAIVQRLLAAYPACDAKLVIDPRVHGHNLKVSNLINLHAHARHDWFVIADSDIAVEPDYLVRVTADLADPSVGIVTCTYEARPVDAFWARVGAQFIDAWFIPSVRVASALGSQDFGFGATIAMRRDALAAIGGFERLSNRLADDFWLGELTRRIGLRTVLSDVSVTTDVTETDFTALWTRELRWMRTIRSLNPLGFAFTFVTYTFPMLALALALSPTGPTLALALLGAAARVSMSGSTGRPWLAPLRDTLLCLEWAAALVGTDVQWRGHTVPLQDDLTGARSTHSAAHRIQEFSITTSNPSQRNL